MMDWVWGALALMLVFEGLLPFLSPGALGCQVEQLQGSAHVFTHRQLLLHLDIVHVVGEG